MDIFQFKFGTFDCTVINDGNITIRPTSKFFEGSTPDELAVAVAEHGLSADGMTIPCSIMLVDTGVHRILVDCGSDGEVKGYDADLGYLFDGLAQVGVEKDAITHVILTHGHFDHFAGCADDDGNPYFKNATYVMDRTEYKFWTNVYSNGESERFLFNKLVGIKDQLQLIDGDTDIIAGVRLIATAGHTMNHVSVEFESDGQFLLCPIDVMDHYLQGQHPTWGADWDMDRAKAIASRKKILQHAVDTDALVHGFHFPFPGLGRFSLDGEVYQWKNETF